MNTKETILKGVPICRGIAIGQPLFFSFAENAIPEFAISANHVEAEIRRYHNAVQSSRDEIRSLQKKLESERILEGVTILDAQLQMMQDPLLTARVESEIRKTHKNAESALQSVVTQYERKFNALADSFFRDRFKDIQDITRRIMTNLRASVRASLSNIPLNSIVFSKDLTASDTAEANISSVGAFVTEYGGVDSHAAIVAKARGTPYVSSIPFDERELRKHTTVVVDGRTGQIILSPSEDTLAKYQKYSNQLLFHMKKLDQMSNLKSETFDGYPVALSANIEMANELDALHTHGGHGVGLYRSEYIVLNQENFPSEEEQYEIYRKLVENMKGLPIVIRTFDVGGDKGMPGKQPSTEVNPYLGCRAIRFLLREKEIFKTQLRAIMRASVFGDVSIMFPMVSTLPELMEAKQIMQQVYVELEREGVEIRPIRTGCMIEVPSAAIIADLLAKECDFLSIGTNDLVQYALAVDRGNHMMSSLYTPTHPSVLRLIKLIVYEANQKGIPVTICGEVAADPRFTPLLLGLGVHELSVATRYLPIVKHAIRNTSIVEASRVAEMALSLQSSGEIYDLLTKEYKRNVPDDCFYNC